MLSLLIQCAPSRGLIVKASEWLLLSLAPTVLVARPQIHQCDNHNDQRDAAQHNECASHDRPPFTNAIEHAIKTTQRAVPNAATGTENGTSLRNCPKTNPPAARFARSGIFSIRTLRRALFNRSIVMTVAIELPSTEPGFSTISGYSSGPGCRFCDRGTRRPLAGPQSHFRTSSLDIKQNPPVFNGASLAGFLS